MTEKELQALTERHFAPSENKTLYHVCRDCDEPCVYTEEEWAEAFDTFDEKGCCACVEEVSSPLPKADFQKLAAAKVDDEDFWINSVLRDEKEDSDNEDL